MHRFYTTRNDCKLHYITNYQEDKSQDWARANLAIFLHGYPDSCMMWRHLLDAQANPNLHQAILICVDLPGYGGSDGFRASHPDDVLDAVADFVIAMREQFLDGQDEALSYDERKTYIIGHDWGCVVAMRLAAEAACLADRYILLNGPHPELAIANKNRIVDSSAKIFRQFKQAPVKNRACLTKAFHTLQPFLYQALLFGYIAIFQLPAFLVKYLCLGGNMAFLRGALQAAYRRSRADYNEAESLASTFGPSPSECKTELTPTSLKNGTKPCTYGKQVSSRAGDPGAVVMSHTSYYRDGLALSHWTKSLEIIAELHNISTTNANGSPMRRRSSSNSSGAFFTETYKGCLHGPATILWGQKDQAITQAVCLDGIGDYLARDSEVVLLPRTGHWLPVEKEGRDVLAKVLEHFVVEGNVVGNVGKLCADAYPGATVMVRK